MRPLAVPLSTSVRAKTEGEPGAAVGDPGADRPAACSGDPGADPPHASLFPAGAHMKSWPFPPLFALFEPEFSSEDGSAAIHSGKK